MTREPAEKMTVSRRARRAHMHGSATRKKANGKRPRRPVVATIEMRVPADRIGRHVYWEPDGLERLKACDATVLLRGRPIGTVTAFQDEESAAGTIHVITMHNIDARAVELITRNCEKPEAVTFGPAQDGGEVR